MGALKRDCIRRVNSGIAVVFQRGVQLDLRRTALEHGIRYLGASTTDVESSLEIVLQRSVRAVLKVSVAIRQTAEVTAIVGCVVAGLKYQIAQIGGKRVFAIVVIYFSTIKQYAPDSKIENVCAGVIAGVGSGKIIPSGLIDDQGYDWMVDSDVIQIPLPMQD